MARQRHAPHLRSDVDVFDRGFYAVVAMVTLLGCAIAMNATSLPLGCLILAGLAVIFAAMSPQRWLFMVRYGCGIATSVNGAVLTLVVSVASGLLIQGDNALSDDDANWIVLITVAALASVLSVALTILRQRRLDVFERAKTEQYQAQRHQQSLAVLSGRTRRRDGRHVAWMISGMLLSALVAAHRRNRASQER